MSLKVWLPLDGDLRNLGCSSVEVTNNGATINNSGKIGKCYEFDGTDDYLSFTTNNFIQPTSHWSVTAWINLVSGKNYYPLFHFGTSTPNTSGISGFSLHGSYCNRLEGGDGSHIIDITVSGTEFAYDKWLHVSLTYDKNKLNYYLNGNLMTTIDWNYGFGTQSNISIGKFWGPNLTGRLNDFRIYDHCLSAAEVREISQGLVLHYKLNQNLGLTDIITGQDTYSIYNNYGVSASITNLSETYQGHIVRREVMTPTSYSVSNFQSSLYSHGVRGHSQTFLANTKYVFWIYYRPISHTDIRVGGTASNIGGWTEIPPQSVGGGWYRVGQYRDGSVTSNKTDDIFTSFYTPTAAADTPITIDWAAPHLLAGTTEIPSYDFFMENEVIDSSGYGHNGTINGTLTISLNTVKYSSCVYMPKTTTIIHPRPIYGGTDQEWTCCMWVKLDTISQSGQQMNNFNSGNNIVHATDGKPLLYLNSGANDYYNYGNLAVSAGVWTHIAFVFKNSNATKLIYINGENHTNTSGPNKTSTPSGIQDIVTVGYNLAGYIADYRIYCTPLLDTDIKMLYNVGMKVDNLGEIHSFEFKEAGGRELIQGIQLTNSYGNHDENSNPYLNYNSDGEIILTGSSSIGSKYIPTSPTGKTYYYDIEVSIAADNQFYFGFERYDANKTARSNNACAYVIATKPTSDLSHKRYFGTVDLSTDGTNPCAFIAVRILNDWSNASGRTAIVHRMSLREVSTFQKPKLYKTGTFLVDELKEHQKAAFYNNNIVEATEFIEK